MPKHRIGSLWIERVVEYEGPALGIYDFLPEVPRELVESEFRWMAPTWFDPTFDHMVNLFQSFIIKTKHHTILCDTCNGNHRQGRKNSLWNNSNFPYMENFLATGFKPEDIDIVMCTHLHGDHVGWNTHLRDGRWVPTFPNAVHLVSDVEMGLLEQKLTRGPIVFYEDSLKPIIDAGMMKPVSVDHEIDDQACLELSAGHTLGHTSLRLRDSGQEALIVGDAIHHPIQIYFPQWNSRACTHPDVASETRRQFLEESRDKGTLILPNHFVPFRVSKESGARTFQIDHGE